MVDTNDEVVASRSESWNDMKGHYQEKLDKGLCWRECGKICPAGKAFLKILYSWNETNPLDPMLVWKVCDPCHYEHKEPKPWRR